MLARAGALLGGPIQPLRAVREPSHCTQSQFDARDVVECGEQELTWITVTFPSRTLVLTMPPLPFRAIHPTVCKEPTRCL
jgi:hypothetical protein